MILNWLNNAYRPNHADPCLNIQHFCPDYRPEDRDALQEKASPSRKLSDLFWLKMAWPVIQEELGDIHVCDVGCGKGGYAARLQAFSGDRLHAYRGLDMEAQSQWESVTAEHPFATFATHDSAQILPAIPEHTNFFMTQSAIEHFDEDLTFFDQLAQFIERRGRNTIQMHLFPSAPCLWLYLRHGVRQYTPRTVSKIIRRFNGHPSYAVLYGLGGPACNRVHHRFITQPISTRLVDRRDTETDRYLQECERALQQDLARPNRHPSFYALAIHSHYNQRIFDPMASLSGGAK